MADPPKRRCRFHRHPYYEELIMWRVVFITGQAGTGKTTKLLDLSACYAEEMLLHSHQKILAMAYMHGARRRLESRLDDHPLCKNLPRLVTTIDSFAMSLVNRWGASLGVTRPVTAARTQRGDTVERYGYIEASFDWIAAKAADLLHRPLVARLTADTYPLVIIDEFQDCLGPKLGVVEGLASSTHLLLAADSFQLLQAEVTGCPAAAWIDTLGADAKQCLLLTEPHRTSNPAILNAARSLREGRNIEGRTVTVYFGGSDPVAWRIMERLFWGWYDVTWKGTTAIICPTIRTACKVLTSLERQMLEKKLHPVHWARHSTTQEERSEIYAELGITEGNDDKEWVETAEPHSGRTAEIATAARRFSRLRGIPRLTNDLVARFADKSIQSARAHSHRRSRFEVTTVHGSKNREFDNVFVLWPYEAPPGDELRRRLLYNAITRAKSNCMVFDMRKQAVVESDPVMRLLGPAQPVFAQKKKIKKDAR